MVSRVSLAENLKKAEMLKEQSLCAENITNTNVWSAQQKLLNIYEELLILDLEYALDKKVEQDLWNFCFKNYIAFLQNCAKDNKSKSGEVQAKLSWFLECASGFYLTLLQEISTVFNLDLPFKRSERLFGVWKGNENRGSKVNKPKINSCYYICQHCLVHLGDIARYRNQIVQAESFYRQAVALGASSGHPYNQLALLEASRGDKLSTVFYYVRSIAVAHRFPAAVTNLNNTFNKYLHSNKELYDGVKLKADDYLNLFLRLHGCLYTEQQLELTLPLFEILSPALTPLIATRDFSTWKLVQMGVISIFVYRESDRVEVKEMMCDLLTSYLTALLLPLYTIQSDSILDYFGLAPIKTLLTWMKCEPSLISKLNKPHLWRAMSKLFNELRASHSVAPPTCINDALPEDYDLRGFLPLDPVISSLNYDGDEMSEEVEKRVRAFRLIKLGEWLANSSPNKPIYISDSGLFEAVPLSSSSSEKLSKQSAATPTPSPPQPAINPSDVSRSRSRHNVALQSILRLSSNGIVVSDTGWEDNRPRVLGDSRCWPPESSVEEVNSWSGGMDTGQSEGGGGGMYSLFSGQPINSDLTVSSSNSLLEHQSLWSGPGPSPLERLLEQQKTQRILPDT